MDETGDPDRRWRRRKEARPGEIQAAALEVFAERGFAAAKLDEVARRAGISKGTLYLYFPDKAALFKALVQEAVISNIGQAEAMIERWPGPTDALLQQLIGVFIGVLRQKNLVALPKLIISEAGNFPELAEFYLTEVIQRGRALVGRVIQRGIDRGEFRPVPAAAAAPLVIAPVLFTAIWKTTFEPLEAGPPLDPEALLRLHADLLLNGLRLPGQPSETD